LPIGEFVATRAPDYTLEGESGDRERYLVLAHQAGDPFAFTEIVKDHYPSLYAHALRRLGDQRSAEDAVQDALLRAYKGLNGFSGEFKLGAWLHRIVDNVCADAGSRRLRDARLAERFSVFSRGVVPPVDDDIVDVHAIAMVRSAVAELPDTYREALVLRDVMDMEYADVAEHIGISEENARARVSRARAALRKMVAPTLPAWVFLTRVARRQAMGATRLAARLTGGLSSAAGQATATASQMTAAAATAPPDVLAAPTRFAPVVGTLAATAVAAVASVGIPALVTSSHPSAPTATTLAPRTVQVASGPQVVVGGPATSLKPVPETAAALAPSSTTTSTSSTSTSSTTPTTAATGAAQSHVTSGNSAPPAPPIALQPGGPLPRSSVLGTELSATALTVGQRVVGTAAVSWLGTVRVAHLDLTVNPTKAECTSYLGGTLKWPEGTNPTVQGDLSFAGWITNTFSVPGGTAYNFSANATATGPSTFTGSGWLTGELRVTATGISFSATGWGQGEGAPPAGPGTCPVPTGSTPLAVVPAPAKSAVTTTLP
jgi:RNA polymerase sigma-70 factor (ECF subfamily)